MVFCVGHYEDRLLFVLLRERLVPVRFLEVGSDSVDLLEAFDVADGDFIGSDADVGTIFGVQSVDVVYTPALQCCQFEWESREAGVPGPWHCFQRIAQSAGQDLKNVRCGLGR